MRPRPPTSTLFPYTTLFRSHHAVNRLLRKNLDCFSPPMGVFSIHSLKGGIVMGAQDRKSTRLNSSHGYISYAVFCLKKKRSNKRDQRAADSAAAAPHPRPTG